LFDKYLATPPICRIIRIFHTCFDMRDKSPDPLFSFTFHSVRGNNRRKPFPGDLFGWVVVANRHLNSKEEMNEMFVENRDVWLREKLLGEQGSGTRSKGRDAER
jgi:hypothetical protein